MVLKVYILQGKFDSLRTPTISRLPGNTLVRGGVRKEWIGEGRGVI